MHEETVDIGATKVRGLLGILCYKCNEPVATGYLAEALWGDTLPPEPVKTLQVYVSRLRRALGESGCAAAVHSDHGTYRLAVEPSTIDYQRFLAMARAGYRAFGRAEHASAADYFRTAMELWRGPPIADLTTSWARRLQAALVIWERLPAQSALFESKLALGAHDFVLARLPSLLADHPHDERLAGLWIRALAAANRASEIAAFLRDFTQRLQADLGTRPGAELIRMHQLATHGRAEAMNSRTPSVRVPGPPRDTPHFTGRTELLARLDSLLAGPELAASVVALDGRPGVGKTALVRHWARRRQARFPDGMLHVDLVGYGGGTPLEAGTVMATFLHELGVPAERVPGGIDDRAALLRHTLTGRRMLIILDNALDSGHVRPLLAVTANCPVLITSRHRLSGVAVGEGAEHLTVPELTIDEATQLLAKRIGAPVAAEPEAVRDLAALCDRLPLALRIVAEHAAARPQVPIRDLVDELRQTRRMLDAGCHDDAMTLRSAFSWSVHALRPEQRRLFRLLGLLPGVRFSVEAAGAVAGVHRPAIDRLLDALVGAHLVEQERAGRYRTHDLLHLYAADCARQDEPAGVRDLAMRRVLTWYVRSARNARRFLVADSHDVPDLPAPHTAEGLSFTTSESAQRWFALERSQLVALCGAAAAEEGLDEFVWRLAACLNATNHYGDLRELLVVHQFGHAAAMRVGNAAAAAGCLNNAAQTHVLLGENTRAGRLFEQARTAFHAAGDEYGAAVAIHNSGVVTLKLGQPAEAIDRFREALSAFAAQNREWAVANVRRWLGDAYRELDQHGEAESYYLDAWFLSQKVGDHHGQGATLNRLARLSLDAGHLTDAVNYGLAGLDAHDRTGDRGCAAEVLCTLAMARMRRREYSEAIADAEEAVRAHEEMHNPAGQGFALEILGRAHAAAGERAEAREAWSLAAGTLDTLGDPRADDLRAMAERLTERTVPTPRRDSTRTPAHEEA